jgi:restriction endonuclease Mrr
VSKAGVEKVVNAMADESFRRKVKENPDAALAGYDLTPEEKAAIKSGNTAKLRELGVDERITKSVLEDIGGTGSEGGRAR